MLKKGQVTIFIILGIVIIAGILIFFLFRGNINSTQIPENAQEIYNFVEQCIYDSAQESILIISQNGGYINSPKSSTQTGNPYYNKLNIPEKQTIESEISTLTSELIQICILELDYFAEYKIIPSTPTIYTTINSEEIEINTKFPISIKKQDETFLIENFNTIIPARLGTIYNSITSILENQTPENTCLTCILQQAEQNNLNISLYDYDDNTILFSIKDHTAIINNQTLEFLFVVKV